MTGNYETLIEHFGNEFSHSFFFSVKAWGYVRLKFLVWPPLAWPYQWHDGWKKGLRTANSRQMSGERPERNN